MRALGFFPDKNKFESSANSTENILSDTVARSFIYTKDNNGPRMDPCGTPQVIVRWDEDSPSNSTNCFLLSR